MYFAAIENASVNTGKIIFSIPSPVDTTGNNLNFNAIKYKSINPTQKLGIDNPKKVVPLIRKSITLFFLTAANIPKGTAIINITINDIKANFKVGTNFNNIISITGFFVEYEIPKSPLKQELNQFQYWTKNGSFSPIDSLICWITSSLGIIPDAAYMVLTGSPGAKYINVKVIKLMPNRTIIICIILFINCFLLNLFPPNIYISP